MGYNDPMQHSHKARKVSNGGPAIQLLGIDELIAELKVVLGKHNENEVRKVLKRGAMVIVEAAKRNVNVNDGGRLRDSIKILPKWRGAPATLFVGPRVIRRFTSKTSQKVKDRNPFYAHFVEYGTDPHNLGYKGKYTTGKGGEHPGTDDNPYMRPAYDTKAQECLNIMREDLAKYIETKR